MTVLIRSLQALYLVGAVAMAIYGLHALWLTLELMRRKASSRSVPSAQMPWPRVTVQLPIYNERHVVVKLIGAVASLDYPRDQLQIQILDDSQDETASLADREVARWKRRGVHIELVRRSDRSGFKAGALAHALPMASGEFIAIFDADFQPPPDFLKRVMAVFASGDADLGFVQARWEHLNRGYSLLTSCQALALDGHFGVEQPARLAAGYPIGFNGSAGVWRREAIEDHAVGGWHGDTLTEDLDLAYRAQLAGWRGSYSDVITAPAEIPPQLLAFKRQQFRWAKGSTQTLRKLAGRIVHSEWSLQKRTAALLHLGSYMIHPLLLLLVIVLVPLFALDIKPPSLVASLSLASFGPPLLCGVAQRRLHPERWWRNLAVIPVLMLLGLGLCLGNTIAVWQGLRRQGGSFERTPKFNVDQKQDGWRQSSYRLPISRQSIGELALGLYAGAGAIVGIVHGEVWASLFLVLVSASFLSMMGVELWQARGTPRPRHSQGEVEARAVGVQAQRRRSNSR